MGLPPKGRIVARPMIARACGCVKEFQHYEVDKYRAERLKKFQQSRCPECVAKLVEQQRQAAPPPKAESLKQLPPGTQVSLTMQRDGNWAGKLSASGTEVETAGTSGAGPQAVVVALARLWIAAGGGKPSGE
jgi:hypothetical protein